MGRPRTRTPRPALSRQDIVDSYLNGEISRRTLVRRLAAAGVALSAATAYAELLSPEWASAATTCTFTHYDEHGHYEHYGHYECRDVEPIDDHHDTGKPPPDKTPPGTTVKLSKISLATLLLTGRFLVRFVTSEAGEVTIVATLVQHSKKHHGAHKAGKAKSVVVGRGSAHFAAPGSKKIPVKLTKKGRKALRELRRKAKKHHKHAHPKLSVTATATDTAGNARTTRMGLKLK